jgi:aspartyl/asparaginyl beta-hydroxylase (cupin superfamily)
MQIERYLSCYERQYEADFANSPRNCRHRSTNRPGESRPATFWRATRPIRTHSVPFVNTVAIDFAKINTVSPSKAFLSRPE